jgi:glycosyltransferase involved in cell wall biosynthesis
MSEIVTIPPIGAAQRPRWSVIIPVHNCAGYLAQALPEVLAQLGERTDAEIIVVDDSSIDHPEHAIEPFADRVAYRPNPTHLGAVSTFNRGLQLSTGELVHLLHGDDLVLPGFYDAMDRALADPTALAAVCRVRDIDAAGHPLYETKSSRRGTGRWPDALSALAVSNRVRAPGIVVRRCGYERLGGFRADLPHAADWDMWTRLAAHGSIVFVDDVLACYRRHGASDTSARVLTGANVRERVSAIGVVAGYVATGRRPRITRTALAYAVAFAGRTALTLAKAGEWRAAGRQVREAIRCCGLMVRGVPVTRSPPS